MRILFFGSAAFAIPTLRQLHDSAHEIVAVVTQPDQPAGRGRALTPCPVAAEAQTLRLPLLQPATLHDPALLTTFQSLQPELIVVVAYGKFLPTSVCTLPSHRAINLHPSLLPKYRGAAPIQWALLNGDHSTGITTLYVSNTMDAGDVLLQQTAPIHTTDTAATLHDRLATLGAALILTTVDGLANATLRAQPQDEQSVVLAPKLTKADSRIDWRLPAAAIINRIRGLTPWPGTHTTLRGRALKIHWAEIPVDRSVPADAQPGTVVAVTRSLQVATGDGRLCLTDLQLEGGKRLRSEELLRGYPVAVGERLQ
ncbi:MAG: methionyl-tRNA formyltransferase [Deltaproteobacteria bacterium]|nr:methionyl-tRNA formyltransferase [Deltaproteobacteria bacterium]